MTRTSLFNWQRIGPLSGPANVLNNRFRVVHDTATGKHRWAVEDMTTGAVIRGPKPGRHFRTMKAAKDRAEDEAIAANASSAS